jgi:hypothetical protein
MLDNLIPEVNVLFVDYTNCESAWAHNTITTRHRELYARMLRGDAIIAPTHIALGNVRKEATEDEATFTRLKSEFARVDLTSRVLQSSVTARLASVVLPGEGSGNIDEFGLFNGSVVASPIDGADSTNNWSSDGTLGAVTTLSANIGSFTHLEGSAALEATLNGTGSTILAFDNNALSVDLTAFTEADFLQYWWFVDHLENIGGGSNGAVTTRLYTGNGGSDYYEWETPAIHTALGASSTSELGHTLARAARTLAHDDEDAGSWYHFNLRLSDAAKNGFPDIAHQSVTRFSVLTTSITSTPSVQGLDAIRMFRPTSDLWARVEPPRMLIKTSQIAVGVFWFLSSREGGVSEIQNAYNRETIIVNNDVIELDASRLNPINASGARSALFFIRSGGPINWMIDGTSPTNTVGSGPWHEFDHFVIEGESNLQNFKVTLDSAATNNATVEVEYFR